MSFPIIIDKTILNNQTFYLVQKEKDRLPSFENLIDLGHMLKQISEFEAKKTLELQNVDQNNTYVQNSRVQSQEIGKKLTNKQHNSQFVSQKQNFNNSFLSDSSSLYQDFKFQKRELQVDSPFLVKNDTSSDQSEENNDASEFENQNKENDIVIEAMEEKSDKINLSELNIELKNTLDTEFKKQKTSILNEKERRHVLIVESSNSCDEQQQKEDIQNNLEKDCNQVQIDDQPQRQELQNNSDSNSNLQKTTRSETNEMDQDCPQQFEQQNNERKIEVLSMRKRKGEVEILVRIDGVQKILPFDEMKKLDVKMLCRALLKRVQVKYN